MLRSVAYLGLLLASSGWTVSAASALRWENTRIEITAAPFDEQATGVFKFTNQGGAPVTILEAHADCGCTVPTLEKKTYAAGESGELRAVFTFSGREGRNEKLITIQTDEAGDASYSLQLQVDIPRLFEVRPTIVVWRKGDALEPKTVTIRALHRDVVWPVAVESRDARFQAQLQESADEPGLFTVTITPPESADDNVVNFVVKMNAPADNPRVTHLYARVF